MTAIFERMRGMKDILAIISRVKLEDITKVIGLVGIIQDENSPLRERVIAVIDAADVLVDYTETLADDAMVEFVKNLATEESLWRILAIVQDLLDGNSVPVGALEGDGIPMGANGEKGSIPWPLVIQLAQIIASIIQGLKK